MLLGTFQAEKINYPSCFFDTEVLEFVPSHNIELTQWIELQLFNDQFYSFVQIIEIIIQCSPVIGQWGLLTFVMYSMSGQALLLTVCVHCYCPLHITFLSTRNLSSLSQGERKHSQVLCHFIVSVILVLSKSCWFLLYLMFSSIAFFFFLKI